MTPAYRSLLQHAFSEAKKQYHPCRIPEEVRQQIFYDTNLLCIHEEVRKAREISEGKGSLYINVMVATNDYARQVLAACEAGIDGIVSGAGFPFALPEITKDYPNVALIPILANARGVKVILKKWGRLWKVPDAIVLEDPSRAGGHLGASGVAKIHDPETTLEVSIPATVALLKEEGLDIPIIAAGGIVDRADIDHILALGASGVQMGTRFLATNESGASPEFKESILSAEESSILEYISNAMLPARALKESGIFSVIEDRTAHVRGCVENCLTHCAFRDGIESLPSGELPAQMCILHALAHATEGNKPAAKSRALYFTGTSATRIKALESVKDIMRGLVGKGG